MQAKYAADLKQLADDCRRKGLEDEARKTRAVLEPRDPTRFFVPVLPQKAGPPALPDGAPPAVVEWHQQFSRLRREQGEALFDLARQALRNRRAALAIELLLSAVAADPDNESVRRLLGYQKYQDRWRTPYEIRKLRAGLVWDDRFGWLPKTHLKHYEAGERYRGGRWIPAEEDARRRQKQQFGWEIDTEHYHIRTNHSLEAGVDLGVKLERLYHLWQGIFLRFYASEAEMLAWFDGRSHALQSPGARRQVVYFRDRADYNRFLGPSVPGIEKSIGYYSQAVETAFFFAGPDSDDRTLYHEATHQLFHESRPVAPNVGARANFWIVEGIALYMETLKIQDGFYVLGGADDQRMIAARYRLLHDNFYVPLAEFCGYGMLRWQHDPNVPKLYSQAAGLAQFLIHYDHGRYRDALVAYLSTVYSGRDAPDTLSALTGVSSETLDAQYREFMEKNDGPTVDEK
ncbi:MAG: hypothetical protein JXB10_14465 [Pirellulales bacterium]|nr:hypothetical protein [Pirellulales bacterium]